MNAILSGRDVTEKRPGARDTGIGNPPLVRDKTMFGAMRICVARRERAFPAGEAARTGH
jgi:hypothetical protein